MIAAIYVGADQTRPTGRPHLAFLDGLRGLAALYVFLFHLNGLIVWNARFHWNSAQPLPHIVTAMLDFSSFFLLGYGLLAVDVFIVLSGYCLMLPLTQTGVMRNGTLGFFKRRARRILPTYYAACVVCLLVIACVPGMGTPEGRVWRIALPVFNWPNLMSHLMLVHNFTPYIEKIDPPLWTVATEWQIYFFLPFLLLPLWRRAGSAATILVACVVGVAPHFFLPHASDQAHPWYLALFTFGMVGATCNFSKRPRESVLRMSVPWGWCAVGLSGLLFLYTILHLHRFAKYPWLRWVRVNNWGTGVMVDIVTGAITMGLIVSLANAADIRRSRIPLLHDFILRVLSCRWVTFLGTFSYSLYVLHELVLALLDMASDRLQLTPIQSVFLLTLAATPLCLIVCYLFHLAFERPFMTASKLRTERPFSVETAHAKG